MFVLVQLSGYLVGCVQPQKQSMQNSYFIINIRCDWREDITVIHTAERTVPVNTPERNVPSVTWRNKTTLELFCSISDIDAKILIC